MNRDGAGLLHRHLQAAPAPFLKSMAPDREALVVCGECPFPGYWLADLWAQEGMPLVVGHALYRQAIPGGQATHDAIDSHRMAALRRGGRLPQASGYPANRRATRDLLRRRLHLRRQRAALFAHVRQTHSPDPLPDIGQKIADQATRDGVAERVAEPAVPESLAVDLGLIPYDDPLLTGLELSIVKRAKPHEANPCGRRRATPGVGKIFALVLLDDIHAIHRCPRGRAFVSSCRLLKWAKESAGKRVGTSGKKSGKASLTWAFSEAAAWCLRHTPAGQQRRARLAKQQGPGQAPPILAHRLARAGHDLRKDQTAWDREKVLQG